MVSIERIRKHLPPVAFIFLVLIAVMLVGFACACLTEHPMQAVEKALGAIPAAPAIIEVWAALAVGLFAAAVLFGSARTAARSRASPALLQRFLL